MNWISPEAVAKQFELQGDDPALFLQQLMSKRAELHPDKNGGDFEDDNQRKAYFETDSAISYLEENIQSAGSVIPVSQVTTIVESVVKNLRPSSQETKAQIKTEHKVSANRKYMVPKVGSGVFAGISAFLFSQATSFADHPFLSFFGGTIGLGVLAALFVSSSAFFVLSWIREQQEESSIDYLMSDEALWPISEFLNKHSDENRIVKEFQIREELLFSSYGGYKDFPRPLLLRRGLSNRETVGKIVNLQISKLIERSVLEPVKVPGIDRQYRVLVSEHMNPETSNSDGPTYEH